MLHVPLTRPVHWSSPLHLPGLGARSDGKVMVMTLTLWLGTQLCRLKGLPFVATDERELKAEGLKSAWQPHSPGSCSVEPERWPMSVSEEENEPLPSGPPQRA